MSTNEEIKNKLGMTLRDMREKADKTLSEVKGITQISTKTIRRIEEGEHNTSFVNVAKLVDLYCGTLKDIAPLFGFKYEEDDVSYDYSERHRIRLEHYTGMKYYCAYISTEDSTERMIDEMLIEVSMASDDGYLSAMAKHGGHEYEVKIVSPVEYDYTFFYLTSKGNLKDRALMILPFIRKIRDGDKFKAGIGIMLSFDMNNPPRPCFQKVMVFSEKHFSSIAKIIANTKGRSEYLKWEGEEKTGYKVVAVNLEKASADLYKKCKAEKAKVSRNINK